MGEAFDERNTLLYHTLNAANSTENIMCVEGRMDPKLNAITNLEANILESVKKLDLIGCFIEIIQSLHLKQL